jgi:putative Ca2+/H+ antiporter (TMEM165/GDT1 family)
MPLSPFFTSVALIFVAEMGDKSQLAALAFATRFSAKVTLAGIFVATLLVHLVSVLLGQLIGVALPTFWIELLSGLAFLGFGLWTLRGDRYDDEGTPHALQRFGPFVTVVGTFFLAELGDKTMLATITLGSQLGSFWQVWLGSTIGMVAADALAIMVGRWLGTRLPERAIRYGAAAIFLVFGVWTIVTALVGGPQLGIF